MCVFVSLFPSLSVPCMHACKNICKTRMYIVSRNTVLLYSWKHHGLTRFFFLILPYLCTPCFYAHRRRSRIFLRRTARLRRYTSCVTRLLANLRAGNIKYAWNVQYNLCVHEMYVEYVIWNSQKPASCSNVLFELTRRWLLRILYLMLHVHYLAVRLSSLRIMRTLLLLSRLSTSITKWRELRKKSLWNSQVQLLKSQLSWCWGMPKGWKGW